MQSLSSQNTPRPLPFVGDESGGIISNRYTPRRWSFYFLFSKNQIHLDRIASVYSVDGFSLCLYFQKGSNNNFDFQYDVIMRRV